MLIVCLCDIPIFTKMFIIHNETNITSIAGNGSVEMDIDESRKIEQYMQFRFVVDIFLVGPVCTVGFIGNILSIFVMQKLENKIISFFFISLAIADNSYLVTCFFIQTIKALAECTKWTSSMRAYVPYAEPYMWPLASIAQTLTVWLVVLITVDRYMALCRPFASFRITSKRRAFQAVICITTAAVLFNIPRFFDQEVQLHDHPGLNISLPLAVATPLRKDATYFIVYHTVLHFLFRLIIPLVIVSLLNVCLIFVLRQAHKDRQLLAGNRTAEKRNKSDSYTKLLVAMVTVFIICEMPDFVVRVAITVRHITNANYTVHYFSTITNLLLTVNSAINCLIYSLAGRRFRKALCTLTCARRTIDALEYAEVMQRTENMDASRSFLPTTIASLSSRRRSSCTTLKYSSITRKQMHLLKPVNDGKFQEKSFMENTTFKSPILIVVEQWNPTENPTDNAAHV